jgi:hypothetical protein
VEEEALHSHNNYMPKICNRDQKNYLKCRTLGKIVINMIRSRLEASMGELRSEVGF